MKKSTLAAKACLAALGLSTFATSFAVAGFLAAGPTDGISAPGGIGGDSAPALPSGEAGSGPLDNGLTAVQVPNISGVSYQTGRHGDDDGDHDLCLLDGEQDLPGHNNQIQYPCQSKNNSVGKGKIGIGPYKS